MRSPTAPSCLRRATHHGASAELVFLDQDNSDAESQVLGFYSYPRVVFTEPVSVPRKFIHGINIDTLLAARPPSLSLSPGAARLVSVAGSSTRLTSTALPPLPCRHSSSDSSPLIPIQRSTKSPRITKSAHTRAQRLSTPGSTPPAPLHFQIPCPASHIPSHLGNVPVPTHPASPHIASVFLFTYSHLVHLVHRPRARDGGHRTLQGKGW
ncbi:hypothetical protein B0H12DRAFT_680145 [Mycena haematopus]|nr:hypothetical protein B0H12DRAFT_680145 [Mycena haematopus]